MGAPKPDPSAIPDAEIVKLVLGGDLHAFDELVRRTRHQAYGLARRIMRQHEDADDVVQESYMKAFRALPRFELDRAFGPWFLTIVGRTALSQLRRRARRAAASLDDRVMDEGMTLQERIPDPSQNPEDLQRVLDVERAFGNLSEEHRAVLALRVDADLPYAEIAQTLDIPVGTVMSRLARAREALLEEVKKQRTARFLRR